MAETPSRVRAKDVAAEVRQSLNRLTAFANEWADVDARAFTSLTAKQLTREDMSDFDEARARTSRLLPSVRSLFRNTGLKRVQFGMSEDLDVFGFVLEALPHLGSFHDGLLGDGYKDRFLTMRPRARSLIEQARGELESKLDAIESGPPEIDLLEGRATELGLTGFIRHLDTADNHLNDGENDDAVSAARRALERAVTELANKVASETRRRKFSDALGTLRDHAVIDPNVAKSLGTPNVGLWGWLSVAGTHDEHDPEQPTQSTGPAEARLAIAQTRSAISYLLDRYEQSRVASAE